MYVQQTTFLVLNQFIMPELLIFSVLYMVAEVE